MFPPIEFYTMGGLISLPGSSASGKRRARERTIQLPSMEAATKREGSCRDEVPGRAFRLVLILSELMSSLVTQLLFKNCVRGTDPLPHFKHLGTRYPWHSILTIHIWLWRTSRIRLGTHFSVGRNGAERKFPSVWDWTRKRRLNLFYNGNPRGTSITSLHIINQEVGAMILSASGKHLADSTSRTMLNSPQLKGSFVCTATMIPTSVMALSRWLVRSGR